MNIIEIMQNLEAVAAKVKADTALATDHKATMLNHVSEFRTHVTASLQKLQEDLEQATGELIRGIEVSYDDMIKANNQTLSGGE